MHPIRLASVAGLSVALVGTACATKVLPPYPVRPAAQHAIRTSHDDVTVAVEPLADRERCETYFGMDLPEKDVLPVFVVVENRSDRSLLLQRSAVQIVGYQALEEGARDDLTHSVVATVMEAGGSAAAIGSLFFSPVLAAALPPLIVSQRYRSDASVVQHQLAASELLDSTLSPGESGSGSVYFQLGEVPDGPQRLVLEVELTDLRTKETHRFAVWFPWERGGS